MDIIIHSDDFHEILNIKKQYVDDFVIIYLGGSEIDGDSVKHHPFQVTVKTTINKNLLNKNCHIKIIYDDGKIYAGYGYISFINDARFIVNGISKQK